MRARNPFIDRVLDDLEQYRDNQLTSTDIRRNLTRLVNDFWSTVGDDAEEMMKQNPDSYEKKILTILAAFGGK